ncbi:DUF1573 domain-containing protein [Pedobacter chinensis]|uniref:DUF1573 domain-containing protein n=1 Tax=Pedobacter chinensis TaxID=2282421 RepID=A0A369PTZ1_9SPHI|nr:DUF1573 domain-containing protein [Pedobacter chinensis]RDC54189.1 DUF1573 domain-containing protein [Pedobacter chinensis]
MKLENILLRLVFVISALLLMQCSNNRKAQLNYKNVLKVENDSIDLGNIKLSDSLRITYKLSNISSNQKIRIKSVGTSCGCSKAYFSDSTISPVSSEILRVSFFSTDKGNFNKTIVLETDSEPIYKVLTFYDKLE